MSNQAHSSLVKIPFLRRVHEPRSLARGPLEILVYTYVYKKLPEEPCEPKCSHGRLSLVPELRRGPRTGRLTMRRTIPVDGCNAALGESHIYGIQCFGDFPTGWTRARRRRDAHAVHTPIPVTVAMTLSRYRARSVLVRCQDCNHKRAISAVALAKLIGWEGRLWHYRSRFRCSACHSHKAELFIC